MVPHCVFLRTPFQGFGLSNRASTCFFGFLELPPVQVPLPQTWLDGHLSDFFARCRFRLCPIVFPQRRGSFLAPAWPRSPPFVKLFFFIGLCSLKAGSAGVGPGSVTALRMARFCGSSAVVVLAYLSPLDVNLGPFFWQLLPRSLPLAPWPTSNPRPLFLGPLRPPPWAILPFPSPRLFFRIRHFRIGTPGRVRTMKKFVFLSAVFSLFLPNFCLFGLRGVGFTC